MGLDLTIYELVNYNYEEEVKEHKLVEVAYFSNPTAMILAEWLYRNDTTEILNKHQECHHYIEIFEDDIQDIVDNLEQVINYEGTHKGLLALHYFPVRNTREQWINSEKMFSDSYYDRLIYLHDKLKSLITYDEDLEYGKCFFYNICW